MSQPDDRPAWLPAPPPSAAPPPPPPDVQYVPQPPQETPAWATPQPKGSRLWIYLSGALMLVVLAGGVIWLRDQFLANQQEQLAAQSTPTPLLSDRERADRFLNTQLAPALAGTITPLQGIGKDCSPRTMTDPCKTDLIALNQAMLAGDDALQKGDIPGCIARETNQFKYDWQGMEQGVSLAISGYNQNSYDLYLQGMVRAGGIAKFLQPDMDRITAAEKNCAQIPP